jgi:hypothetical protein
MSGGHFGDYCYFQVSQFARDLEEEILNNNKEDEYGTRCYAYGWNKNHL